MIQIPVLALPTPLREITHGVYCDEFCESQYKDMMARSLMGGFIPSNGVGTGFSRRALEMLAAAYSNRIFEPDVSDGRLRERLSRRDAGTATEIYSDSYPPWPGDCDARILSAAIFRGGSAADALDYGHRPAIVGVPFVWRIRSRHLYWFWRDRKSLVGNLVSPLTNLLFVYGVVTLAWAFSRTSCLGPGRRAFGLAREPRR